MGSQGQIIMTFSDFWNQEVEKCPQLANGDAKPRMAVYVLKAALMRAYKAGQQDAQGLPPGTEFLRDLFKKG
jgi:hypothetical protein